MPRKNKTSRIIHETRSQLYIECFQIAQTIECTRMPFSNISFSHFAVSFPGLAAHVLLMATSLIWLARSAGGWVATYISRKRPSLDHMGRPTQRRAFKPHAYLRSMDCLAARVYASPLQNNGDSDNFARKTFDILLSSEWLRTCLRVRVWAMRMVKNKRAWKMSFLAFHRNIIWLCLVTELD